MKTISHMQTTTRDNLASGWQRLISGIEHRLVQKNRGKTLLSRQIRCRTKILMVRLLEMTY